MYAGCRSVEEIPNATNVIDTKRVYDIKTNSVNKLVRFKARLSAHGDQLNFEDYGTIFSPVASWYFSALTALLKLKQL